MAPDHWFAIFLFAFGCGMIAWHAAGWRDARRSAVTVKQRAFERRKFLRRMQASSLIVLLAVIVWFGAAVPAGIAGLIYWSVALLVVFWIGVLALLDLITVRAYFESERQMDHVERHQWEAEARRLAAENPPATN